MPWLPNPGHVPRETEIWGDVETDGILARAIVGHRAVHVRLFKGWDSKKAGSAPWPAKGGRPNDTNWRISNPPHDYDIKEFEIA